VQKFGSETLLYREHENNAPARAAEEGWEGWEKWLRGHLNNEREETFEAVAQLVVELRKQWRAEREIALVERDRKIGVIEGELCETKAILGNVLTKLSAATDEIERMRAERRERQIRDQTVIERSSRVAELQRENSAARAALERQRSEQALAERDARIDRLQARLDALYSLLGGNLPRGFDP
jgi:hypothetical protein